MSDTNHTLKAAKWYVHSRGWSVIPIKEKDKRPAISSWLPYTERLPTDAELEKWFSSGKLNIAIVTGPISGGLTVIDLDSSEAAMWAMEQNWPACPSVKTARGSHLYFKSDVITSNFQKRADLPGVDLRSWHGYVLAPPSVHPTGKVYEWHSRPVSDGNGGCWPLPEVPNIVLTGVVDPGVGMTQKRKVPEIALNGALPGERNNALASLAGGWIANNSGKTLAELNEYALSWSTKLPVPMDPKEVLRTCKSIWDKDRRTKNPDAAPNNLSKPIVVWFAKGKHTISEMAAIMGSLMAQTEKYFIRGGQVVALHRTKTLVPTANVLKPAALASRFENVACLRTEKGSLARSTEQQAKLIMEAEAFAQALPVLNVISPCPVLVERNGKLIAISGLDRERGIWASGSIPQEPSLNEAKSQLDNLIRDFNFATSGDRSRALASIISPCFVFGGLIQDRIALDLVEADDSQAGKGYFNKVKAAVYGQKVTTITQRRGGVGGIEESLSKALISGAGFICLDNLRGKIDSPAIESLLTEDSFAARIPYSGDVLIDPRRHVIMATSNRAELTIDLSNRASLVRIIKQSEDYRFAQFPEGHLLEHIRANQTLYLGSIFRIIREWFEAGKPVVDQAGHDFRQWAESLGWIVTNVLGEAPLMQGHRETQKRLSSPALGWLREVALIAIKSEQHDWLRASDILEMLDDHGELEIPGLQEGENPDGEETRKRVLQAIGRKLGMCFKQNTEITVDRVRCEREIAKDEQERRDIKRYRFRTVSEQSALESSSEELSCSYSAPIAAPMESPAAPNAPDETEHYLKPTCSKEDVYIKVLEPLGAIGANRSNRSTAAVDIEGCVGCEFLNSDYCSRYDKQCCEIAECRTRVHH